VSPPGFRAGWDHDDFFIKSFLLGGEEENAALCLKGSYHRHEARLGLQVKRKKSNGGGKGNWRRA